jgi:hypothetical protein
MRTLSDNDDTLYGHYTAWLTGQSQTMIDADYASRYLSDYLTLSVARVDCFSGRGDCDSARISQRPKR